MLSLTAILYAAVAGFILPAASAPLSSQCIWTGCDYQTKLFHQSTASSVTSQASASDLVSSLKELTKMSMALQAPANSITPINGPLIVVGQGPYQQIISGLIAIVNEAKETTGVYAAATPLEDGKEADEIFNAHREFVRVHQKLLSIMTGKASLFTHMPFIIQPVAAVLRQEEETFDTLAMSILDATPSRASDIEGSSVSLSNTLNAAVQAHSVIY